MRLYFSLLMSLISIWPARAQQQPNSLIETIARQIHDSVFQEVFRHPEKYRLQIIYTQINRDGHNRPHFRSYKYHADPSNYFNPASAVKLPLAALALQKLHGLKHFGVDRNTIMLTDSSYEKQTAVALDSTSADGYPHIAQYIKKIFLVSDNDAYNRLYEFLGQRYINEQLHRLDYQNARITRRFYPMNDLENRHTNAIRFVSKEGKILYRQKPAFNRDSFHFGPPIKIGTAYMDNREG